MVRHRRRVRDKFRLPEDDLSAEVLDDVADEFGLERELANEEANGPFSPGWYLVKDVVKLIISMMMVMMVLVIFVYCVHIPKDLYYEVEEADYRPLEKCFPQSSEDDWNPPHLKVVFVVIDAWRIDFLTGKDSPMTFLRSHIHTGQAVVFDAVAHQPTVTMPRIQALACGTIPSYATLVLNFFAKKSADDSWVHQARIRKKKLRFFGDDTWMRLFPEQFEKAQGVTSFFVNDYTHVDRNVSNGLRTSLKEPRAWDGLVLHYLGLDHIGHSLGGESDKIPVKLREYDDIIKNIYDKLANEPTVIIIVGDHGMTKAGGHGGASDLETHVPVVVLHNRVRPRTGDNVTKDFENLRVVQQMDVAATMSFFLRIPQPYDSIGLSLVPYLADHWHVSERNLWSDHFTQVQQLKRFISRSEMLNKLSDLSKKAAEDGIDPNVCRYIRDSLRFGLHAARKAFEDLQRKMLSATIDIYSYPTLALLAIFGAIIAMMLCRDIVEVLRTGFKLWTKWDFLMFFLQLIPLLAPLTSSLIEEEHDMWYLLLPTYVVFKLLFSFRMIRFFVKERQNMDDGSMDKWARNSTGQVLFDSAKLLVLHRMAVAFSSQKRRRWIMYPEAFASKLDPDFLPFGILKRFGSTFTLVRLTRDVFPVALSLIGLFWLLRRLTQLIYSSTVRGVRYPRGWRYQMRLITWLVGFVVALKFLMLLPEISNYFSEWSTYLTPRVHILFFLLLPIQFFLSPCIAIVFYLVQLVRTEHVVLLVIVFEMGYVTRRVYVEYRCPIIFMQTAFFYMGIAYTFDSIDIAVAYRGLTPEFATMPVVAFQMLMNMYACPIVFILSYTLHNDDSLAMSEWCNDPFELYPFVQFRVLMLHSALFAVRYFRDHIFIWSVFAPKFVFEILHFTVIFVIIQPIALLYMLIKRRHIQEMRQLREEKKV